MKPLALLTPLLSTKFSLHDREFDELFQHDKFGLDSFYFASSLSIYPIRTRLSGAGEQKAGAADLVTISSEHSERIT